MESLPKIRGRHKSKLTDQEYKYDIHTLHKREPFFDPLTLIEERKKHGSKPLIGRPKRKRTSIFTS